MLYSSHKFCEIGTLINAISRMMKLRHQRVLSAAELGSEHWDRAPESVSFSISCIYLDKTQTTLMQLSTRKLIFEYTLT